LNPRKKKKSHTVLIVSVVLCSIILVQSIFPSVFPRLLGSVGIPLLRVDGLIARQFSNISVLITTKKQLLIENSTLHALVEKMQYVIARAELLALENQELKKLLGRMPEETPLILATVLARPPQTAYDSLIIDVGSTSGVAVGDRIVAHGLIP